MYLGEIIGERQAGKISVGKLPVTVVCTVCVRVKTISISTDWYLVWSWEN